MISLANKLYDLKNVSDTNEYHPEESVLSHSLQAMKIARKEAHDNPELIIAAAFHDLGKLVDGRGHEKISIDIMKKFGYKNKRVFQLIDNHMRAHWYLNGKLKKLGKVKKFVESNTFSESMQLARFDTCGRKAGIPITDEKEYLVELLEATNMTVPCERRYAVHRVPGDCIWCYKKEICTTYKFWEVVNK